MTTAIRGLVVFCIAWAVFWTALALSFGGPLLTALAVGADLGLVSVYTAVRL